MDLQLSDKTAVVTGASTGIGRAIALALGAEGMRLAIMARRRELLDEVAAEIVEAGGAEPVIIVCNYLDDDAPGLIADTATSSLGAVDVIVNNAGGSRAFDLNTDEEQWDEALTLNFTRPRQLTHRLLDQMMQRQWGRIINITGKSEPVGINGAFCAKAGIHSWAKGLSREVGGHGITVNCIAPGRITSEQIMRNYSPEFQKHECETEIPVGEYGQPADLAALVCFMASPLSRYITGTVIPVDGGLRRYQF